MEDEEACFWWLGPPVVMFETGAMEVDGEAPDVGIPPSYFFGFKSYPILAERSLEDLRLKIDMLLVEGAR